MAGDLPFKSLGLEDVRAEYERLTALGVRFVQEPTTMGPCTSAVLDKHERQSPPDRPAERSEERMAVVTAPAGNA